MVPPHVEDLNGKPITGTYHPTQIKGDETPPPPEQTYAHNIVIHGEGKYFENGDELGEACDEVSEDQTPSPQPSAVSSPS